MTFGLMAAMFLFVLAAVSAAMHDAVAVLDGGLSRWRREAHPVRGGVELSTPGTFTGEPRAGWRLSADDRPLRPCANQLFDTSFALEKFVSKCCWVSGKTTHIKLFFANNCLAQLGFKSI